MQLERPVKSHRAGAPRGAGAIQGSSGSIVRGGAPGKRPSVAISVGKAAEDVRALFHLPRTGRVPISLPRRAPLRIWLLGASVALATMALPLLVLTGFAALGFVLVTLFGFVAGFSPLAAILLLILPCMALLLFAAALTVPFWPASGQAGERLKSSARGDPRLVMLVSGICKVINAAPPAAIYLIPEPRLMMKPSPGALELYVGTPLLACLSIRHLAALIARECGRWSDSRFQPAYALVARLTEWLETSSRKANGFASCRPGAENGEELRGLLTTVVERIQDAQILGSKLADWWLTRILALLRHQDPLADAYEAAILGGAEAGFRRKEKAIQPAWKSALRASLQERHLELLANSLARLTRDRLNIEAQAPSRTGVIRSGKPAFALLENFEARDEALTSMVYRSHGINPNVQLYSVEEIRRRKANTEKLRRIGETYYGPWLQDSQYWLMPGPQLPPGNNKKALITALNQCIRRIRYLSPDRAQILSRHHKTLDQIVELRAARKLQAAGLKFHFRHCSELSEDLGRELFSRESRMKQGREDLRQQNALMGKRIALGLALDQQNRTITKRLYRALLCLGQLSERTEQMAADLRELAILVEYKPSNLPQSYQAHSKELLSNIATAYRSIRRGLQQCPYDFYDRRFPTLAALFDSKVTASSDQPEPTLPEKASLLLELFTRAHHHTSELAASYAARMEKGYRIETVKRV